MDKKSVYEQLARIYLDAHLEAHKREKKKGRLHHLKKTLLVGLPSALLIGLLVLTVKGRNIDSQVALMLSYDAVKINFDFDPAKKEIFSINLNSLNMRGYKKLRFTMKKADYTDTVSLRVEFTNSFNETSEVYLSDIGHRWQEHTIDLSEFKTMIRWSHMKKLAFIVEEWNTRNNKGVVYIDNVSLIK
ncbi:hypothetical protein ACFL1K_02530 [Candidatus Omnitrophota bacterium]